MYNIVHALSTVLIGGTMARQRKATGRGEGAPPVELPKIGRPPKIEVPVHRLAEYVPASFSAASQNENDPLNNEDARWYKTGDNKLMLVLSDGMVVEFDATNLSKLIERAQSMSITDVDDLLDLT